jgi:hypothetical protein
MINAMSRQAQAERERRAKIIHAEGEFQAAARLAEAGDVMADQPATLQLRYLQTLTEIASERNSTVVFPIPIDLINMFLPGVGQQNGGGGRPPRRREVPALGPDAAADTAGTAAAADAPERAG